MSKKIVAIIGFPTEKAMLEWVQDESNIEDLKKKYPDTKAEVDLVERQIVIKSIQENDEDSGE